MRITVSIQDIVAVCNAGDYQLADDLADIYIAESMVREGSQESQGEDESKALARL